MFFVASLVGFTPAQLKMWSMRQNFDMIAAMNLVTAAELPMSNASVKCGVDVMELQHKVAVSATEEAFISVRARVAPRPASLMLVARPIPLPAPVIKTILFSNDSAMFVL